MHEERIEPQALSDGESSVRSDPDLDPAQADWARTLAADSGQDIDGATEMGADPAANAGDRDQVPSADLVSDVDQPETQGEDPVVAELGEDGEGDLAPEDL